MDPGILALAAVAAFALAWLSAVAGFAALAPATMLGVWAGKHTLDHVSERFFIVLVEVGLVISGVLLLIGL